MLQRSWQRPKKLLSRQSCSCQQRLQTVKATCRPWQMWQDPTSGRISQREVRDVTKQQAVTAVVNVDVKQTQNPKFVVQAQAQPPADTSCLPVL